MITIFHFKLAKYNFFIILNDFNLKGLEVCHQFNFFFSKFNLI
jgi:hypothetical protein